MKFRWKPQEATRKHIAKVSLKHSIELSKTFHVLQMDVLGEQVRNEIVIQIILIINIKI